MIVSNIDLSMSIQIFNNLLFILLPDITSWTYSFMNLELKFHTVGCPSWHKFLTTRGKLGHHPHHNQNLCFRILYKMFSCQKGCASYLIQGGGAAKKIYILQTINILVCLTEKMLYNLGFFTLGTHVNWSYKEHLWCNYLPKSMFYLLHWKHNTLGG